MIKINTVTLAVSRESIPNNLKGLSASTLSNLQTELNPVPDNLTDIEYWPEDNQPTIFNSDTHKLGDEILTPDLANKKVITTHEVVALTTEELASALSDAVTSKVSSLEVVANTESAKDLTVNSVIFKTDNEAISNITSSLSLMGRNSTESINFKAVNGWAVADKATLEGMQDAVWAKRKSVNVAYKLHEDAINALTTVSAVADYDITTGWV